MIIKKIKPGVFTSSVLFLWMHWDPFGSMTLEKVPSSYKYLDHNDTNNIEKYIHDGVDMISSMAPRQSLSYDIVMKKVAMVSPYF